MARIEKTVFISYRRTDVYTALAIYENLKNQGYDVFFDYKSISSGDFEQIITSNIRARAHFLLVLTPTALDRLNEPGDWLRREIETAIDEKRNIIPLFFKGFRFSPQSISDTLTGKLRNLSRYNGLNVHEDYFDEAMLRLRTQFLNIPLDTVLHPVSNTVQRIVREEQIAADKALEQIEDVKELVKQADEKPNQQKAKQKPITKASAPAVGTPVQGAEIAAKPKSDTQQAASKRRPATQGKTQEGAVRRDLTVKPTTNSNFNFRLFGVIAGGALLLSLLIWGPANLFQSTPTPPPESTETFQVAATQTSQPESTTTRSPTNTPPPTISVSSPTAQFAIGSTMTGEDGMTLLYVPAGEFTMGSTVEVFLAECQKHGENCDSYTFDEAPPHVVNLDAFWIDQTEITNDMYATCVDAGNCSSPSYSNTYYEHSGNSNRPVFVSWDQALDYCTWVERRLPTEAEWERAARGDDGRLYPWGNAVPNSDLLNYQYFVWRTGNTAEVGQYPSGASPYGALDMVGNVWEWTSTLYESYPYDANDGRENLSAAGDRVVRGSVGVFFDIRASVRRANRTENPDGFRCSMSATP